MSSLEELLPEMAGVFAAQESALGACVAVLTTQLQNLALDTHRHVGRVGRLEAAATRSAEALVLLQRASEQLQQQHAQQLLEMATLRQAVETAVISSSSRSKEPAVDVEALKASLARDVDTRVENAVDSMVSARVAAVEAAVLAQLDARLLESSARVFAQAQASEEAAVGRLELLEKKFEYLSKIKMEIKELGKRVERQDQTLDDMRTGLSLLAKSVGTDEIDDEDEEGEKRRGGGGAAAVLPVVVQEEEEGEMVVVEEEKKEVEAAVAVEESAVETVVAEEPAVHSPPVTGGREEEERTSGGPPPEETPAVEPAPEQTPPPEPATPAEPQQQQQQEPEQAEPTVVEATPPLGPPPAVSETEDAEPPTPVEPELETPSPVEQPVAEPATVAVVEAASPPPPQSEPIPVETPPPSIAPRLPSPPQQPIAPSPPLVEELEPADSDSDAEDAFAAARVAHPPMMMMTHMPTAPNLSTVALIRSRRQERSARRGQRRETELMSSSFSRPSTGSSAPLSREAIRVLWLRVFSKIIQLRRLQAINGTSPERTLFRKQHLSMGARVKRLEETSIDLEDSVVVLETSIQSASLALQSVHSVAAALDRKTKKLDDAHRSHAQALVAMDEKFDAVEAELRRARTAARRDSTQQSVASAAFTQIAAQMQDVTARLGAQASAVETHETLLQKLVQSELPGLSAAVQAAVAEMRADVDHRTRELGRALARTREELAARQAAGETRLATRLEAHVDALYRDLLVVTSASVVGVELAAKEAAGKKGKPPLELGVALLHSVLASFDADRRRLLETGETEEQEEEGEEDGSAMLLAAVVEKLQHLRHDLGSLTEQAAKAATLGASTSESSKTKPFEDHLVALCTSQLRGLEELLVAQSHSSSSSSAALALVKDLVIQLRAVLFLLVLHAQLVGPPQQLRAVAQTQASLQSTVASHSFSLAQIDTLDAVVKLLNARLDGFVDLSFSFAKDADVKRSVQELLASGDDLRTQLGTQIEASRSEGATRDELLERDVVQLAARVAKKLDKDEMLWTQEVLERQLQGVAKSALGGDDLAEIQRALRAKLDKAQFHALLQQQHAKLLAMGGISSDAAGSASQPLAATKCISCNGELPSKPQLQALVREEVQNELAKAMAHRHAPAASSSSSPSPSSSSSFSVSSHRSVEKHRKEVLLAAGLPQKKTG